MAGWARFAPISRDPRLFDGRVLCMEIVPAKVRVPAAQSMNDRVVIQIKSLPSIEKHLDPFAPDQAPEGRQRLVDGEPRTRRFLAEQSAFPVQETIGDIVPRARGVGRDLPRDLALVDDFEPVVTEPRKGFEVGLDGSVGRVAIEAGLNRQVAGPAPACGQETARRSGPSPRCRVSCRMRRRTDERGRRA